MTALRCSSLSQVACTTSEPFSTDIVDVAERISQGYHGAAVGKGRQLAKTELEKLNLKELTIRQAVIEAARM